jgi:hypothetical protein
VRFHQIIEGHLELSASILEGVLVICLGWVSMAAQPDEIGRRTGEFVAGRGECELTQETIELIDMVRFVGADQKMDIDEMTLHRAGIETEFDVRKEEVAIREPTALLVFENPLI